MAVSQHEPHWWVPHSAAELKHSKQSRRDLEWKPQVRLPEAAGRFWPLFFYCSRETTLPVSNQWAFLRRSRWQELCPRTKAKMNFFCRRKVSPDATLALAPCSSKNKGGCAGSGGRPEAALPQLSLQAVRSFWHQPYFTSTIIYCRQYPADGDCLFLLFFLAFLQAVTGRQPAVAEKGKFVFT